jgi:hypothetical protein
MIVSNYLSLSCPCFMGGTPMPRGVLQEPQTKKFGVRRQAVFRATPLFEQCVSAHSAERKRCRDPRTARLLSSQISPLQAA